MTTPQPPSHPNAGALIEALYTIGDEACTISDPLNVVGGTAKAANDRLVKIREMIVGALREQGLSFFNRGSFPPATPQESGAATPRTDAVIFDERYDIESQPRLMVSADFARTLEREVEYWKKIAQSR